MSTPNPKPVFIIVPGAAFTPVHYGYISHLLMQAGYGVVSSIFPSTGTLNSEKGTVKDDTAFVRNNLILPLLDNEERDVIVVAHSYGGMPASAAVSGVGKSEHLADGKKRAVLGQIHIASIIPKGDDGNSLVAAFGGQMPPHVEADETKNLVRCADPVPPMMQDVSSTLARAAARSTLCPSLTCFNSPVPRASWNSPSYKGRIAYIKTLSDAAVPLPVQEMLIGATGQEWIVKEIDTRQSPSLSQPEKLMELLVEIAGMFQAT